MVVLNAQLVLKPWVRHDVSDCAIVSGCDAEFAFSVHLHGIDHAVWRSFVCVVGAGSVVGTGAVRLLRLGWVDIKCEQSEHVSSSQPVHEVLLKCHAVLVKIPVGRIAVDSYFQHVAGEELLSCVRHYWPCQVFFF